MQFLVNQGGELIQGSLLPLAPGQQQLRDVLWGGCSHSTPNNPELIRPAVVSIVTLIGSTSGNERFPNPGGYG
jgi:hypothetical protein